MSSFVVFSASDYTVMSSDSLASHKTVGTATLSTKCLTKLSVLGRDVYAVGIGDENPVFFYTIPTCGRVENNPNSWTALRLCGTVDKALHTRVPRRIYTHRIGVYSVAML